MNYYIDLFSPETFESFSKSQRDISGFRERHRNIASRIEVGDIFICYMTKLSRWVGALEITSTSFVDNSPIFYDSDDPFVIRFKVKPLIWLDKEYGIPIFESRIWDHLSFTKNLQKGEIGWTGKVRGSLNELEENDAKILLNELEKQLDNGIKYPIDEKDYKKFVQHTVRTQNQVISVSVPEDEEKEEDIVVPKVVSALESTRIQAKIAELGEQLGMKIWLPRNDRSKVTDIWKPEEGTLLQNLPLNYDNTTIRTIEQIDVIWLKGRSIKRAFEIEHTTSIYSGILRMADLLALQPNMDINLHIVAPLERRDKVFVEIKRPVFSLLEKPLSESCTYISYDAIDELFNLKHISEYKDTILDQYSEDAEV